MENNTKVSSFDSEVDLKEIVLAVKERWKFIGSTTFVFTLLAVLYSFTLPDIYSSTSLIKSKNSSEGTSISSGMSGLASFAGINLGGAAGGNNTYLAINTLQAADFLKSFHADDEFLKEFMAVENYDKSSGTLVFDEDIYDISAKQWINGRPSLYAAHKAFNDHLMIFHDDKTDYITVTINHRSAFVAQKWLNRILIQLNEYERESQVEQANESLVYLYNKIKLANLPEVKAVLASLIKQNTQTIMLSEISEEFFVEIIDSANLPEKKTEPSRSMITLIGIIIGFLFSLIYVLAPQFLSKE